MAKTTVSREDCAFYVIALTVLASACAAYIYVVYQGFKALEVLLNR